MAGWFGVQPSADNYAQAEFNSRSGSSGQTSQLPSRSIKISGRSIT